MHPVGAEPASGDMPSFSGYAVGNVYSIVIVTSLIFYVNSDLDLLVIKNGAEISIDDETEYAVSIFNIRLQRKIKMKYDVFFRTDEQARRIAENGGACKDAYSNEKTLGKPSTYSSSNLFFISEELYRTLTTRTVFD